MIIGFTGTRRGCTSAQLVKLHTAVAFGIGRASLSKNWIFLHGGAPGADAEFDYILAQPHLATEVYPSTLHPWSTYVPRPNLTVHPPARRSRAIISIVERADYLIVCLAEPDEQPHGGTWMTVRAARKAGKPITIILPDGSLKEEEP